MRYRILKREPYKRSFKRVEDVLNHKPEGWLKYEGRPNGLLKTVMMEYDEMMEADKDEMTHKQIVCCLEHLAAASIHALHKMTCD